MSDRLGEAVIQNPLVAVTIMIGAMIFDVVVTPIVLSLPAVAVLQLAPEPLNTAGWLLFPLPLIYILAYLFVRDTDEAWPIGPAERVLFSGGSDD